MLNSSWVSTIQTAVLFETRHHEVRVMDMDLAEFGRKILPLLNTIFQDTWRVVSCLSQLAVQQVEHQRSFAHRHPDCCALYDSSSPQCRGVVGILYISAQKSMLRLALPRSTLMSDSGPAVKNLCLANRSIFNINGSYKFDRVCCVL